jgi:hypothetical protein
MKANELRIGNLVTESNIDVISIEIADLQCIKYGDTNYKPIPLTERWLLKFGFKKDEVTSDSFYISIIEDCQYLEIYPSNTEEDCFIGYITNDFINDSEDGSDPIFLNEIKHVHRIQNLYFGLTGEELTIK